MSDPETDNHDGFLSSTAVLVSICALAAVLFLCAPVVKLIRRRQRPWENHEGESTSDPARTPYSLEQEEEIRQLAVLERISDYTKTLQEDDIEEPVLSEGVKESAVTQCTLKSESSTKTTTRDRQDATKEPEQCPYNDEEAQLSLSEEVISGPVAIPDNVQNGCITVPVAGETWSGSTYGDEELSETPCRSVSNGCAVCLCEFEKGNRVTWASNEDCSHVFHEDCILKWLLSQGRKTQSQRRNNPNESTGDPLTDVTTFPMVCPCCRQDYVAPPEDEGERTDSSSTSDIERQSSAAGSDAMQV